MRLRGWCHALLLGAVVIAACGGATEEADTSEDEATTEPDTATLHEARADSVAMAEEAYDPAAFDSIAWKGPGEKVERGRFVWEFSCTDCHGPNARGDGPVATRKGFDVPNFNVGEWEYAGDVEKIRHRVFVGHDSEMPSWGLYGLTHRDIDAVAYYVSETFGR